MVAHWAARPILAHPSDALCAWAPSRARQQPRAAVRRQLRRTKGDRART